ncbi:IgGFc-binding protein, partial [Myxococcota bacterium]|nr:IgGFc-binding protein [Myxococcota bacterium]
LNIQTRSPGADLTGTRVLADKHVVVFAGSEAANAPNTNHCIEIDPQTRQGVCEYGRDITCRNNYDCNEARLNTCCADHLEQQMFPINTLGRHYIASKSYDRGLEDDYWRILATEDNTKIETIPPQVAIPTLNAGQHFEFGSREHFEIISDKPVLVGQFLAAEQAPNPNRYSSEEPGDAGTGDPAFILAVPAEQFRRDFVFLAPDKYAFDYVNIIAPGGAAVFFDEGVLPVSWEPVGDSGEWQVARFPIGDGVHFIQADQPIAVIVYGYDQYVSYGYPGGLNLDVVEEEAP